ncbi:MAG TPA: glutamate--tRNA ligase [Planctomycetaceae bacterium]|nr:glutamate--tRNA ligase [Planctomycetaceae bacterium]
MTKRTRFAPSPTGYLHIGGVRTALFNWLLARQSGGQFILRIDDTDAQRNVAEALQPILDGFQWLGLDWDEGPTTDGQESVGPHGPYFQSQRGDLYKAAARKLLDDGFAYRDYAKTEELAEQRTAAEKAGTTFVYDRKWMAETDEQAAAFEAEGRTAVVRLKMPREGKCVFTDEVRGAVEFNWAEEQDHVIQRADGSCLYHLATVVDDHEMKITHVVRAVEHLSNTPRQIFIAQSLGYELPTYAHLPFVSEPGGTAKLSKRKLSKYLKNKEFADLNALGLSIAERANIPTDSDTFNPVIVDFYQAVGFLPAGLLNYLVLLGWSLDDSTEDFSIEQMIEHFSTARITKGPASFDPQKLTAFQARWMQKLSVAEKSERCGPFLEMANLLSKEQFDVASDRVSQVISGAGDRIKVAGDILDYDDFFRADDALIYDEKAFEKRVVGDPAAVELMHGFVPVLEGLDDFTAESVEAALKQFVESEGVKVKAIIHALRLMTTGKVVGFSIFETLAILGKDRVLARVAASLAKLPADAE